MIAHPQLRDAVHNGFARRAGPPRKEVSWIFPGEAEEEAGADPAGRETPPR